MNEEGQLRPRSANARCGSCRRPPGASSPRSAEPGTWRRRRRISLPKGAMKPSISREFLRELFSRVRENLCVYTAREICGKVSREDQKSWNYERADCLPRMCLRELPLLLAVYTFSHCHPFRSLRQTFSVTLQIRAEV